MPEAIPVEENEEKALLFYRWPLFFPRKTNTDIRFPFLLFCLFA